MKNKWVLVRDICFGVLSFLLPLVILIIVFSVNKVSLFSYKDYTITMLDMQSEYIAYLRNLKQILLHNDSLIYTNTKVFGGDYLSIFTFYLSSPFNLFVVFFNDKALPLFFVWSSIIKMALASLNFYLLARFTGKFSYHKVLFALGYGLISYSLIYLSNYMWLDGVMILPLVVLGLHFLKDGKQYWLYPLAIGYSLMTSWYIGFMICVFSTIYFIYLFIAYFKKENLYFLKFLLRFVIFSLIGGFIAAPYWLTAFIHLSGTKGFSEIPKLQWFSISVFLSGLLENNYTNVSQIAQYRGYISMFTGIVPLVFFITFFFNKEFTLRDRLAALGVFLFYFIFSSNTVTAALLHGGKEPTWFPGRYSFVIGFFICYIASRSADESHKLHPVFYSIPLSLGVVGIIILSYVKHSTLTPYYPISEVSEILYFATVAFGFILSYVNRLEKKENLKFLFPIFSMAFVAIQVVSIYRGTDTVIRANINKNALQTYETYLKDDEYQQYFDNIKEYEKEHDDAPFYRMEAVFNRPGNYNRINNNPMFYSYNGLSNYSSSSKKDVESYLGKLGFHYNYFFAKYENGSTYSINSLLGIKYLLEDTKASYGNKYRASFMDYDAFNKLDLEGREGINYYINPNAVSLGFVSDETTSHFINEGTTNENDKTYWFDHFEYQNQLFKTLNNSIGKDIFIPLHFEGATTDVEYTSDEFGIMTFKNVKSGDTIRFTYTAPDEVLWNPSYFGEKNYQQDISYLLNGSSIGSFTYQDKGTKQLKGVKVGTNTLTMRINKDFKELTIRPELYYENLKTSKEYLDAINSNSFNLTKVTNGSFKKSYSGTFEVKENAKDLIFTLPHESGIKVYVDGKRVSTKTKLNVFTAISLNNIKKGNHKITILYQDTGLIVSMPIFMVSIFALPPLFIFYDKLENLLFKKRRKEEI